MFSVNFSNGYYLLKFVMDAILLALAFFAALWLRFGVVEDIPYVLLTFGTSFSLIFFILSFLRRDYMQKIPRDALDSFFSSIYTFSLSYILSIMSAIFLIPQHPSRMVMGFFLLIGLPMIAVSRYGLNRFVRDWIVDEPHKVLIAGAGQVGKEISGEMKKLFRNQIEIVGFLDDHLEGNVLLDKVDEEIPVLGKLNDFQQVKENRVPDSLFISISNIPEEDMLKLMEKARGVGLPVKIISDVFDIVAQKVTGGSQEKFPVVEIQDTPVRQAQYSLKRSFDLFFGSLLILLSSPVLLASALAVKLTSDGPVFYRAERMKNRNETFQMLKFRTMYADQCGQNDGLEGEKERRNQSIKDDVDPRITPVGRWLRRFSIDELPQLFNVIKGDMSLVGPRPPAPSEVHDYEDWHYKRLDGWAGITGLWQVSGRTNLDFEDMVLLDVYYIENWSLYLDFKILLKTIPAVLSGRGAN